MRIVFFGSPEFALPSLEALLDSKYEILAVISQPDKPKGRRQVLLPTPVKSLALENGLKVLEPFNLNEETFVNSYKALEPQLNVIVAYGRVLPGWIIDYPLHGSLNAHPSLLPKYRGPAPITRALTNGDKETGVTIQYVVEEMDAGDVLLQKKEEIVDEDNSLTLATRLAKVAAQMMLDAVNLLEKGALIAKKQDEKQVVYAPKIIKEELKLNLDEPAHVLINKIRAFAPRPGAFALFQGKRLKILKAEADKADGKPGEILKVGKFGIQIGVGDKSILLKEVQAEGAKAMEAFEFAKGHKVNKGTMLVDDR